jgi:hypothetical protein
MITEANIFIIIFPLLVSLLLIKKFQKDDIHYVVGVSVLWFFYWWTFQKHDSPWTYLFFILTELMIIISGIISIWKWYRKRKGD